MHKQLVVGRVEFKDVTIYMTLEDGLITKEEFDDLVKNSECSEIRQFLRRDMKFTYYFKEVN